MSGILVKAYASFQPVSDVLYESLRQLLVDWHLEQVLSRQGDHLRISHEGVYFPAVEVARLINDFLDDKIEGKLDYIDLENWHLHRYSVSSRKLVYRKVSLDIVLDSCAHSK